MAKKEEKENKRLGHSPLVSSLSSRLSTISKSGTYSNKVTGDSTPSSDTKVASTSRSKRRKRRSRIGRTISNKGLAGGYASGRQNPYEDYA